LFDLQERRVLNIERGRNTIALYGELALENSMDA
jgi:hypothetical protein